MLARSTAALKAVGLIALFAAFVAMAVAGCATLPYAAMTPEQITALSKIKDATAICVSGVYAGANVTTVSIAADRGVPSGVVIEQGCKTTFTTTSLPNPEALIAEQRKAARAEGVAEGRAAAIAEAEALEKTIAERIKAAVDAAKHPHSKDLLAPQ